MINVAFIKFAGLASGGTEKYLQSLACLLPKEKYKVDYFFTNNAPRSMETDFIHPDNDPYRKALLEQSGIKTIPIHIETMDIQRPSTWNGTNFWEIFKESDYDLIQTARGGYPEYPFTLINNCPIIDSIHGFEAEDKQNIKKAILLCDWQAKKWVSNGGNIRKVEIVPSIVKVPEKRSSKIREKLNIPEDAFIYGFHQASRPDIYSHISIQAYSTIENQNTHFILLGGCAKHIELAQRLGIKNIHFIKFTSSVESIHDFISGIDVYTHSRSDGEVCSASIIEAMYHGKPVISHPGLNMGHLEQISDCGKMTYSIEEYSKEMKMLKDNKDYYLEKSEKTLTKYKNKYDYKIIEKDIINIYNSLSN
jgi:glycosyltransferase involved in cell wall biosynthesis